MLHKKLGNLDILACSFVVFLFVALIGFTPVYSQANGGEKIFTEYCNGCHGGGFVGWLSGAPKIGEQQEWKPFMKKGLDKMVMAAIKGTDRMDPKGECDICTDQQIRETVEYIVSQTN